MVMDNEAGRVFHDVVLDDLGKIRGYVRATAVAFGCDPTAVNAFVVAVNEAVANIIQYGYKNELGDIKVTIYCSDNTIKVTLLDTCHSFDPTTVSTPDTSLPLAERPFGGMGVHLMREFCDEVTYRRTKQNENELTLLKRVKIGNEG
jgi:serine/threonine-protein kinase RsbW